MRYVIKTLIGAVALNLLGPFAGLAADMPAKAPMPTKAAAIAVDPWNGWYLGASAGARWNTDTWTATGFEIPTIPGLASGPSRDLTSSSARFGLYGGYNWHVHPMWVVGVEADIAWASNKTDSSTIPGLVDPFVSTVGDTVHTKDLWDGGVRGRLGYLITPSVLVFGTGGAFWMRSEASITCGPDALVSWCGGTNFGRTDSVSKTVFGWTVGAGVEASFLSDWLARIEYRYTDYDTYHATLLLGGNGNADVVDADIKVRTHTVLVGVAHRFGR